MTLTRSRILIAAVVVVLAALGIALVAGTRDSGKKSSGRENAPVTVSGTKLEAQPSNGRRQRGRRSGVTGSIVPPILCGRRETTAGTHFGAAP